MVEERWEALKKAFMTVAEICGVTKGEKRHEKETWWWNEGVQDGQRWKKSAFKK